jgi:flagellar hook-associated protein 1 FlgK
VGSFSLLNIGSRAMTASYTALQTTGHNIANAGVKGYSRQTVELTTAEGQNTGAGYLGRGVKVNAVTRAHDEYLALEAVNTKSVAAMDRTRAVSLRRLEEVFSPGENGIGYAAGQFFNAMVDVASRPADDATRQVVLARAAEAADRFSGASDRMDAMQQDVEAGLRDGVEQVNSLAQSIARINQKVQSLQGEAQAPLDLLDERERLISALSEKLQLNTVKDEDGSIAIFIAGGRPLVMGGSTRELSVIADPLDAKRVALAMSEGQAVRVLDDRLLAGGDLSGFLQFQNQDLVRGRVLLGQMASAFVDSVNKQQSYGLNLNSQFGGDLFFDFHDPVASGRLAMVQAAVSNFGSTAPSLTVKDASKLQADEYLLAYDGAWKVTSRSNGKEFALTSLPSEVGFELSLPPGLDTRNRFLLQPVTYAAGLMRRVLDVSAGIAAASPAVVNAGAQNRGTASVSTLKVTSSTPDTTFSLSYVASTNKFNVTGAATVTSVDWTPGAPLSVAGVEIHLNGQPANGDTFVVSPTTQPRQNNTNALAMVALRDASLVGKSSSGAGGSTITDAYASAMADIGVRVQGATTKSDISTAVADQSERRRASDSGVNLDEEAARLLQFQQAYQASAKVLQAAQSVFDTLLQAAG